MKARWIEMSPEALAVIKVSLAAEVAGREVRLAAIVADRKGSGPTDTEREITAWISLGQGILAALAAPEAIAMGILVKVPASS